MSIALSCRCALCGQDAPSAEMGRNAGTKSGMHSWCKACLRLRKRATRRDNPTDRARWSRWTRYRMSEETYQYMLSDSKGLCAICAEPMKRVCIDHNHSTKVVRGLLCHSCNVKLHAVDTWAHLPSALSYLKKQEVSLCDS